MILQTNSSSKTSKNVVIGIDWADQKHDYFGSDSKGRTFHGQFDQTPEGIGLWIAELKRMYPDKVFDICIEQSKGALISGLLMFDCVRIFPINPVQLASYRKAMSHGGSKNDPGDAFLLCDFLLNHREQLRSLEVETPETRRLQLLTEDRRRIVNQRTELSNQLQSCLKQYFPLILRLVRSSVHAEYICRMLLKWPTLEKLKRARLSTIRKFFYGCNLRGDHVEEKLQLIEAAQPLTTDPVLMDCFTLRVQHLANALLQSTRTIAEYDRQIEPVLKAHCEYSTVQSLPGAGVQMQARLIAALGTDRNRFHSANSLQSFSGIAPVEKQSGNTRLVNSRWACPKFIRQTFHEFAGLSIKQSAWAKAYYDLQIDRGKKTHAAKRALAFKWQRIIFRCWQDRVPYDEHRYIQRLKKNNSPLLQYLETTAD